MESQGYFGCPACGSATRQGLDSNPGRCGVCERLLPDANTPILADRQTTCPHCGYRSPISRSITEGWKLALVQRLCEHDGSVTVHFELPGPSDVSMTTSLPSKPPCLDEDIPEGLETRVLRQAGFRRWWDLYPTRQLRCLIEVADVARSLDASEAIRQRLLLAIVGASEMAGYLCRWDRHYPKAFEAMANHRYSSVGLGVEVNLLSVRGRGTLPRRLAASVKAAKWARQQLGKRITPALLVQSQRRRWPTAPSRPLVVTGSSERQLLPSESVDLVLTDPPYFDSVQYGELSSLFQVWAKALGFAAGSLEVDLKSEAVPNRARGTTCEDYERLLQRIFSEVGRSLKPRGRVLLTFHSTDMRAWRALGLALATAGLKITGLATCHAENEADHSKRGKRAFTKDLIIECQRVKDYQGAPAVVTPPKGDEDLELVSAGLAIAACGSGEMSSIRSDFLRRLGPGFLRRIR
jgi:putative DNA methylase